MIIFYSYHHHPPAPNGARKKDNMNDTDQLMIASDETAQLMGEYIELKSTIEELSRHRANLETQILANMASQGACKYEMGDNVLSMRVNKKYEYKDGEIARYLKDAGKIDPFTKFDFSQKSINEALKAGNISDEDLAYIGTCTTVIEKTGLVLTSKTAQKQKDDNRAWNALRGGCVIKFSLAKDEV